MTTQTGSTKNYALWRIILIPILLAVVPLIYPEVKALLKRKQPQFILENPIIKRGDQVLIIEAENAVARNREDLNVEIGGIKIKGGAKLIKDDPHQWEFRFGDYSLPKAILAEGLNMLLVSFPGNLSSNELNFYISANYFQKTPVAVDDLTIKTPQFYMDKTNGASERSELRKTVKEVTIVSEAMDDDGRVGIATKVLQEQGVEQVAGYRDIVGEPDRKQSKELSQVSYFHARDKKGAEQLARFFKDKLDIEMKAVDYSQKIKTKDRGKFEIWMR